MAWLLLVLGIALWYAAHLFKRVAPDRRAALGARGQGPIALALLLSVLLMVLGYRWAEIVPLYAPWPGMGHLNNLAMLVAAWLFFGGSVGSWLASRYRHPMLTAAIVWAVAHLLVNGDLASVLLFGSLGIWAALEIAVINRAEDWAPARVPFGRRDAVLIVVSLIAYAIITAVHVWLGHNPFLGSYG